MDRDPSIPDIAVMLVIWKGKLDDLTDQLRAKNKDWTTLKLVGEEAVSAAASAMTYATNMLDRLGQLAREELARK